MISLDMVSETRTFYSCRSNKGHSLEFTADYLDRYTFDEGRRVQRSKPFDQDNIPRVNKVYFTVKVGTTRKICSISFFFFFSDF